MFSPAASSAWPTRSAVAPSGRTRSKASPVAGLLFVVVAGLIGQLLLDFWWLDPLASLAVVWLLVREGSEAWTGEGCCDDCA